MAILKSSAKLILREFSHYNFAGSVLTLGVPEIYATYAELREWFPTLTNKPCNLQPSQVAITNNETGRRLGWVTMRTFLSALGLSDVTSIDIPGCEHPPDLMHDLNLPMPAELSDRFNLIIDPGTTEHVFDIKTVLTSLVRALQVGGVVVHQVPVYSYNGGYYSINPNVLNDFYAANGFSEIKTFIIMWDRYRAYTGKHWCYEYSDVLLGNRHALADYDQCRFSPHMLFFARKTKTLPDIVIPIQFSGNYVAAVAGAGLAQRPPSALVRLRHRLGTLSRRWLPYPISFYIGARLQRERQLREIRRHGFWM